MKIIVILASLVLVACGTSRKEMELAKPIPPSFNVSNKKLNLKGEGIKWGSKLGFTAKVYKAGYYLENLDVKNEQLFDDNQHQHIFMRFVYDVTRHEMRTGWQSAFEHSCVTKCSQKEDVKRFIEMIPAMKIGHTMEMSFPRGEVEVTIKGKQEITERFKSKTFRKNLLSVFFGPKVKDEKLKKQLLGLAKAK